MALDPEYLDAIKTFEGYSPSASWDYKQNSSGYGTKAQPGDENIPPDQLKAVHEGRFQSEIEKAAAHVDSVNPDLPPGVKAALTSLTYNAGPGWSQSGLGELIRNGDLAGAQAKLLEYNKAGGEVNQGLVARRQKEAAWFGAGQPGMQVADNSQPYPNGFRTMQVGDYMMPQMGKPSDFRAPVAPAAPPIFAPQPQPAPQQQSQEAPQEVPAFAQMSAPPIFAAPRRQIDLSKLKAALAAHAPIFPRG